MRGYRARSAKGKGTWGEARRKWGAGFRVSSPSGVTWDTIPPARDCDSPWEASSAGEAHRRPSAGALLELLVQVASLRQLPKARLPGGRQAFDAKPAVCTHSLGRGAALLSSGNGGSPPHIPAPGAPRASPAGRPLRGLRAQACWPSSLVRHTVWLRVLEALFPVFSANQTKI